jgi:putative transcriptional regulator
MAEPFTEGYLTGQLLVAMPTMRDPRFTRTVIFMCAHNADGAMGLVLNRLVGSITFPDLLAQLGIPRNPTGRDIRVHFGGPVDTSRGFVLHSPDYSDDGTMMIGDKFGLTASLDILRDIAGGGGPRQSLLALGYAGWGPGQLDTEIQANGWLSAPADEALLFDDHLDDKWERAIGKIGVHVERLSGDAGHA